MAQHYYLSVPVASRTSRAWLAGLWPEDMLDRLGYSTFLFFSYFTHVDMVGLFQTYSRVHISSDTAFLKILKKPSIVQE